MTNGNNFSDQNRVNRSNYEGDRLVERPTPTTGYEEENAQVAAQNAATQNSVNARPATADEIAYRNGYTEAQNRQRIREDIQRTRAENSAATGTLLGILIASIAGLVLAALYFIPGEREPQVVPAPTASPAQRQNNQAQPQQGTNRTTIIERVREVPAAPQNTEIIVTPSSPEPAPTQTAPTQTAPTSPSPSEQITPDSSVTEPVDPAIPADPNQSLSQPNTTLDGTDGTGADTGTGTGDSTGTLGQ